MNAARPAVFQRNTAGPTWLAIGLVIAATLVLYRDTAAGLVQLWGRSETFAHGYVVPIIVLWLLWRQRDQLAALAPSFKPAPSALWAIAALAAVWLVGDAAEVNAVRQFAFVGFIVLTVPALAGWHVARALMFPLGFLFFAVPFGDFLLPWLMARTADFTVVALRASGIPVYRDGMQLVIPSGTWSVVEACSGIRYLIASLMVGALFAHLNYRSTRRRLMFMLVALLVPIVANWLRAYMIVMIGHLSNNTLALGVDHLIYGWVFFGVVIGIMFFIGSRWSEAPADDFGARPAQTASSRSEARSPWVTAIAMALLLAVPLLVLRGVTANEDRSAPVLAAPAFVDTPEAVAGALPPWKPAFVNPSAVVERQYDHQGRAVGLYLGYYRGQGPQRKLVSSTNSLVPSDDPLWQLSESGNRSVDLGQRNVVVNTARLRRPLSSHDPTLLVVRQVYWVNGRFEAGAARAKAWGALYRLLGRGDDGAVLIVYAQEHSRGDADAVLDSFLRKHLQAIEAPLRKARDGD